MYELAIVYFVWEEFHQMYELAIVYFVWEEFH